VALQLQPRLLPCRAVREWYVIVRNIIEEVDFLLLQEKTCGNGVNWSITPTFIEESSVLVEGLKEIQVCL
jgi:hypothetical protein